MFAHIVEGTWDILRLPLGGAPYSILIMQSVEAYLAEDHSIASLSFYFRCLGNGIELIFNGNFFYLLGDFHQTLRDFLPFPGGSKDVKFSGVGVPLGEKVNGEVENLTPNFSPAKYFWGGGHSEGVQRRRPGHT